MRAVSLALFVLALLVAGCDDNPFRPSDVMDVTWKLESIERAGNPTIQIPSPERYTLRMEDNGRLTVGADCNQCTGTYTLAGSTLTIGTLACTLMGCGLGSLDGTYANVLTGSSAMSVVESHLVLRRGDVTLRFRN